MQYLGNRRPHLSDGEGLLKPRLSALLEKRHTFRGYGIPRHKNDPLAQVRVLARQEVVEG